MNREEILNTLNELKPLVKAENEAKNNWSKEMYVAWHKPLAKLAHDMGTNPIVTPKKNFDGTNNWDVIETIGIGDIVIKVD